MRGKVVAIIPARGGSKGLCKKNIRELAGRPMIAWSIEAAKTCPLVDRIIVSTDDQEIKDTACEWGAEVPFFRPQELSGDLATTESALKHALRWLQDEGQYFRGDSDVLLYLQADMPYRKKAIIAQVIESIQSDLSLDTVFAARSEYKNFWLEKHGNFSRLDDRGHLPRQIKDHIFMEDTGTACAIRPHVISSGKRIGNKVKIIKHQAQGQFIDFNSEFDLKLANVLDEQFGVQPLQD